MTHPRKIFFLSGILQATSQLITGARKESNASSYETARERWAACFTEKQISPYHCDVIYIFNFLSELFQAGYDCRTICLHRTVISAYHEKIEGVNTKVILN